jgi:hypothetical protein
MGGRLKQIWTGFEGVTTRRLTGSGVEHLDTPSRRELEARTREALPADLPEPAKAAFSALHQRLTASGQRAIRREEKRSASTGASFDAPPAPLSAQMPADAAPEVVQDLVRGLRATSFRTERLHADYPATPGGGRSGRKKFFGLF